MTIKPRMFALLAALMLMATSVNAATADFNAKDGQILGRTLGFLGTETTGLIVVGIVFVPVDPASQQEADRIRIVIGDGLATGRTRLQVRLIQVEHLAGATGLSALYLTTGLANSMEAVFRAAQRLNAPTISANLACVETGGCIIGFSSEPTVQILLDQGAAERTGVDFRQAFRMLVRHK